LPFCFCWWMFAGFVVVVVVVFLGARRKTRDRRTRGYNRPKNRRPSTQDLARATQEVNSVELHCRIVARLLQIVQQPRCTVGVVKTCKCTGGIFSYRTLHFSCTMSSSSSTSAIYEESTSRKGVLHSSMIMACFRRCKILEQFYRQLLEIALMCVATQM